MTERDVLAVLEEAEDRPREGGEAPPHFARVHAAARELAGRRWRLLPCRADTKAALIKDWRRSASNELETVAGWFDQWPAAMIGALTGAPNGFFVIDVDVDPAKGIDGEATLAALVAKNAPLPETRAQRTPRGGRHLFFAYPEKPIKNSVSKLGHGLDVRGDGGYVVVAPSINGEGVPYEWVKRGKPAKAPPWLLDLIHGREEAPPPPRPAAATHETPTRYLQAAVTAEIARIVGAREGGRNHALNEAAFNLGTLVGGGHLSEAAVTADLQAAAVAKGLPAIEAQKTILSGLAAGKAKPRDPPTPSPKSRRKPERIVEQRSIPVPQTVPAEGDWRDRLIEGKDRTVLSNLANVLLAFREDPAFDGLLAYDEMARSTFLMRPLIRHNGTPAMDVPTPRPITDEDVGAIQEWLQVDGIAKASKDTVHQAVDMRAKERSFHPVRDYLKALQWDGEERLDSWLYDYLKAEPTEYAAGIGPMFFIAMVARIFKPGCKADYMLILEGEQGAMKSTACSIIGGEWFSDSLPEKVSDKDTAQHLRGKWLIELGELHAMSKADGTALKAFITRPIEMYRPSYGRKEVHDPRQCLFIGTTNRTAYLKDETGGRRFWPVKVGVRGALAVDRLRRDRDQLFAEAVHRFRQGERWWPDRNFEIDHVQPEQEARFEADAWEDVIGDYLEHQSRVTVTEIARNALSMETARLGTAEQRRISAILERLGWSRGPRAHGGIRPWIKSGDRP